MARNGIAHIQLTVNDPARCVPFWKKLCHFLGMKTLVRNEDTPYMLLVAPVRAEHRDDGRAAGPLRDREAERAALDAPAVTHVDYSERTQTVHAETNPLYHALLERFLALTGCPVLVNTSFNVRGEPIVCKPEDA